MQTAHTRYQTLLAASVAIHRLLLTQQDLPTLLQGVCDQLVGEDLHRTAWMVLLDSEVGSVITAETGLGERFNFIMDQLRNSELPECGKRCLEQQDNAAVYCHRCSCGACTNVDGQCGAVAVAIRCRAGLFGFLVVELPSPGEIDQAELQLLREMADSISQALRRLFAVEESRQREHELKQVEERFELALYASQAGLWDWNIKTGEMYTSHDRKDFLDYREGNGKQGISSLQRLIHPDDREKVLQVLNDHLAGKTDEYRIEYRIRDREGDWQWFLDRGRVVERDEKKMPLRMTGTHQDITRQKKQDEAMAVVQQQFHAAVDHERSFLQTVIDGAADPVMAIDTDYNVLLMNKVATELLHVDPEVVRRGEKKCYQLFSGRDHPCTDEQYPCPVQQVLKNDRPVTLVHNPYHGNCINNTFEIEVSPLRDTEGEMYGIIEVARDITDRLRIEQELRESRSQLYRLAHHDSLTGLPNRLLFKDRLEQAIFKARRKGTRVAVLFLDLDRFKNVNDTLGHDVGDELLIEVARRFQTQCRQSDTVARIGGDEFVFILDDIGDQNNAELVAGKIMDAIARPVQVNGHELHISTSIGIAIYPDDSDNLEDVIKCADTALYQAKGDGRSSYKLYKSEMGRRRHSLHLQEQQMAEALRKEQFFLEYQSQLELRSKKLVGLEALIRWRHPEQGVLYPQDFLFQAEESGLIVDIGSWVLQEVCRQIAAWQQEGLSPVPVAVNISPRQLRDGGFQTMVEETLTGHGLSADLLEIELDEAAMRESHHAGGLHGLEEVSRLGVRLAVEDFGCGRFSLGDLQRLPLSRLKIDSSFMGRLSESNIAVIVDAIIVLAHNLGITVLAEGVEREEQLQFLLEHDCDQVQGYYLARPAGAEVVSGLLAGK
ncbi:MAG: EAL domain-containing protein [Desulfobulbaceae bacterium]|nr:EAL domain-containing protein [Desulfobulbaceae bacterium]